MKVLLIISMLFVFATLTFAQDVTPATTPTTDNAKITAGQTDTTTAGTATKDTAKFTPTTGGFAGFFMAGKYANMETAVNHTISPVFGIGVYANVSRGWAELLVGPSINFWRTKVALKIGISSGRNDPRFGGSVDLDLGTGRLGACWELNASDGLNKSWYNLESVATLSKVFGVGVMMRQGPGFGPRLELNLPGSGMGMWVAPLWGGQESKWTCILEGTYSF